MFDREAFEVGMHASFPLQDSHPLMPRHRRVIRALGECGVIADSVSQDIDTFREEFHTLSGASLTRILNNAHQRASILSVARHYVVDFWTPVESAE